MSRRTVFPLIIQSIYENGDSYIFTGNLALSLNS